MVNFDKLLRQHPDLCQILFYAFILTSLWTAERLITGTAFSRKWAHNKFNAHFIFTALPVQLTITLLVLWVMAWDQRHHWSLANFLPGKPTGWLAYLVLFALLDLGEYVYHVIMHKLGFLWKFHLIHHSDPEMDVSTTLREHPVDTAVRTGFLAVWVLLLGPTIGVLMLRQVFQSLLNLLAHAEFRLPQRWHRIISLVFITPNLHHVHHHHELPYTDWNYGDVLSVWDRLFGTHGELPERKIVFGVDVLADPAINSGFIRLLLIPFRKPVKPLTHEIPRKNI